MNNINILNSPHSQYVGPIYDLVHVNILLSTNNNSTDRVRVVIAKIQDDDFVPKVVYRKHSHRASDVIDGLSGNRSVSNSNVSDKVRRLTTIQTSLKIKSINEIPYEENTPTAFADTPLTTTAKSFFPEKKTDHNRGVSQGIKELVQKAETDEIAKFYQTKADDHKAFFQDENYYAGQQALNEKRYTDAAELFVKGARTGARTKVDCKKSFDDLHTLAKQDTEAALGLGYFYLGHYHFEEAKTYFKYAQSHENSVVFLNQIEEANRQLHSVEEKKKKNVV